MGNSILCALLLQPILNSKISEIDMLKISSVFNQSVYTFRPLSNGQRGEVYEVSGNRVAVIFDCGDDKTSEGSDKTPAEQPQMLPIHWVDGIIAS